MSWNIVITLAMQDGGELINKKNWEDNVGWFMIRKSGQ